VCGGQRWVLGLVAITALTDSQTAAVTVSRKSGREEKQSEPGLSEVGTKGGGSQCLRTSLRRRTACFGLSHEWS
jgi:hypothetical protein